jgi:hypothetical protein
VKVGSAVLVNNHVYVRNTFLSSAGGIVRYRHAAVSSGLACFAAIGADVLLLSTTGLFVVHSLVYGY